jgi:O-antigen/teichoic acid export membrane protein
MPDTRHPVHNTRIIARNSLWYGLEVGIALFSALAVSIGVARVMGPEKLGYYAYITWLTNMSNIVGCLGIPMSTRKYMAEYLARGEHGVARAIFFATLRLQAFVAAGITAIGLVLVFTVSEPSYRVISAFLVGALLPRMTLSIPSQANMARENMRANVPASVLNNLVTLMLVALSLLCGWGLTGVAVGMFLGHCSEFTARIIPTVRWARSLPHGVMPPEVRSRMISFSGYGMVLMLLNAVVWDRSDIVFLKALCSDIRQVSFFSVVFNISEKILLIPQTFAHAIGVSVMAQYGRDEKRLISMVSNAGRYVFLCAAPLLLGAASLSSPLIRLAYGSRYLPSIPIMAVVCVLAIPKSLLLPAQHLLQTTEHQKGLVIWQLICAIMNVSLDLLLIPKHAAMGAALANGATQLIAMLGMWGFAMKLFPLDLRLGSLARILLCGGGMTAAVLLLLQYLHGVAALVCGVPIGAIVFLLLLRITGALESADMNRLQALEHYVPGRLAGIFHALLSFLVPLKPALATQPVENSWE